MQGMSEAMAETGTITGIRACVFDTYGTLLDSASAVTSCPDIPDDKRKPLASLWREKQLSYTWLLNSQNRHLDFWRVTGDALDFALDTLDLATPDRRAELMARYRRLTPYPEVAGVLRRLRERGVITAILSNGTPEMLGEAVGAAELTGLFDHVLSAEDACVFKPDPRVYQLAVDRLELPLSALCFLSSNGWDVYAASAFGMHTIWCNRQAGKPERLPGAPDQVIETLTPLPDIVAG
jgi:2-haloacid dehalogenase